MIKNLRSLRTKNGLSQQALANILGISQQSVNKYENHDVEPDISMLIAIADYFNVSIDYLVGREYGADKIEAQLCKEAMLINSYNSLTSGEKACVDLLLDTFNSHR